MTWPLFFEQLLNGLQYGATLFMMSAGLTLVFGVMGVINLAHGVLYMFGAFICASVAAALGSFWLGLVAAFAAAAAAGVVIELSIIRRLYNRDHLDQVLATFALILIFTEGVRYLFGSLPLGLDPPLLLSGVVNLPGGVTYPLYRLAIIVFGALVAVGLFWFVARTRIGVQIRAGEADRDMIAALGVNIDALNTFVFALGAALAGIAGGLIGATRSVEVTMGDQVLILAFVVIVIGGIGSIRGALIGSLIVGVADTLSRALTPSIFAEFMTASEAARLAGSLGSILIYLLMAIVLIVRPRGLFAKGT